VHEHLPARAETPKETLGLIIFAPEDQAIDMNLVNGLILAHALDTVGS
jgi:hypothetical protein